MNSIPIRKISENNPDKSIINEAVDVLNDGGIVVCPTETRYGLLVRIDNQTALKKIYDLKRRPENMASSIFLKSIDELSEYAYETDVSRRLAEKFLPGPLTLILKSRKDYLPPVVTHGKIGIRISSSEIVKNIVDRLDIPVTATSANLSGEPDKETIDEIFDIFGLEINLYLDSGRLNALTSTVVYCEDKDFGILRAGAVTFDEITTALNSIR